MSMAQSFQWTEVGRHGNPGDNNAELSMEIRGATNADLAEIVDLQCLVFRPTEDQASARYWSYFRDEPTYRPEQSRLLLDNGRIVAHLRIWDRQIRVRGARLRVGGIGSVLTHPDFRGRGYAQSLMRDAEVYMEQAGYDLGMLFTIIGTPFYAKLGWIPIPLPTFTLRVDGLKITAENNGRKLDPDQDLPAAMALYDAANAQWTGTEVRTIPYWQSGPSSYRDLFPQIGVEQEGQLIGYLNYDSQGIDLEVREVCFAREDEATCHTLCHILLSIAQRENKATISGSLPVNHTLLQQLTALGNTWLSSDQHEKTMVKLINWKTLTAKLAYGHPAERPANETDFWHALFGHKSPTTPAWLKPLPEADGFFYWAPDIF